MKTILKQGFSTVELLIALFIAAAFIATGFQLFSVVIEDGNQTRLRSQAGSVASEAIQKYINTVNNPCSPAPATVNSSVPAATLPQATLAVSFGCPYGNTSKTTRITATVTYYSPAQQIVVEALDVTK